MDYTQKCPQCGAEIAASLVAAIRDPKQDETCPRSATPPTKEEPTRTRIGPRAIPLATLMLLGSMEGPVAS